MVHRSQSFDRQIPLRVAFDLTRLSPGGENGGIKVHLYEFLRAFQEWHRGELSLLVLCRPEIAPELDFLAENPLNELHLIEGLEPPASIANAHREISPVRARRWLPEDAANLLRDISADVNYAAFGDSPFHDPGIPQISLLVDCLHKDLPEMLPPEEVADRERRFLKAIDQATLVQTNSKFCVERLRLHYDLPEAKVFHIYLPLHGRFNRVQMGRLPPSLAGKSYFFYPANHWPHKNHECLLVGFRKYREDSEGKHWELALTGDAPPERTEYLKEMCQTLGIADAVHFLGHLDEPTLKAVWEHCSALVFPSLYEGFGLPILEAMHFQKPIVCNDIPSLAAACPQRSLRLPSSEDHQIAAYLQVIQKLSGRGQPPYRELNRFVLRLETKKLFQRLKIATSAVALNFENARASVS